jgi:hypothetical protein
MLIQKFYKYTESAVIAHVLATLYESPQRSKCLIILKLTALSS